MAYTESTGVANLQSLISAICTFVEANGWTVHRNSESGGLRTAAIQNTGGDYIHLYNLTTDQLSVRISVGYSGSDTVPLQPNVQPFSSRTNGLTGPYPTVYMHLADGEVHVIVETSIANEWRHIVFGGLQKFGAYDGGTYADGTWRGTNFLGDYSSSGQHHIPFGAHASTASEAVPYAGCVRADDAEGSRTNFYHWFGDGNPHATYGRAHCGITSWAGVGIGTGWLGRLSSGADVNAFSGRSVGHPIVVLVDRTGSPLYRSPIGAIRNTRLINVAKFASAQETTVGSDVWKVYPAIKRSLLTSGSNASPDYGTHTLGYAVRKVV